MLKAWHAGKLGRPLATAGVETRTLRRVLAASEDALTSSVLGRVSYLPVELQHAVLSAATPLRDGDAWPLAAEGSPRWEFWPTYSPAPGDGGKRVEPDLVVRWGGRWLVVEVKHEGHQHEWQWERQLRAVAHAERVPADRLVFLALGGRSPEADRARAKVVWATGDLAAVPIFRLGWPAVHTSLEALGARPALDRGLRDLLADASAALAGAGHHQQLGLWTLPDALATLGPAGPFPSLPQWRTSP